jgi:hypothetical protein
MVILYKLKRLPISKLNEVAKKMMNLVIENEKNAEDFIKEFWKINKKKLRTDFINMISDEDIVVSATPSLLLKGISDYLNTSYIYGTEFDFKEDCEAYRGDLLTCKEYIFLLDKNIDNRLQQLKNRKHKSKSENVRQLSLSCWG